MDFLLDFLMEKSEIPIDPDPILEDHWMLKKKQVKSLDSEARPADATILGEGAHTFRPNVW